MSLTAALCVCQWKGEMAGVGACKLRRTTSAVERGVDRGWGHANPVPCSRCQAVLCCAVLAVLCCGVLCRDVGFLTTEEVYPWQGFSVDGACNTNLLQNTAESDRVSLSGAGFDLVQPWSAAALREVGGWCTGLAVGTGMKGSRNMQQAQHGMAWHKLPARHV